MDRPQRFHVVSALVVLAVLAGTASCGSEPSDRPNGAPPQPVGTLRLFPDRGPVTVRVEIAETPRARSVGLMGRRRLPTDAGMVFLFDRPTTNTFWMRNTLIPLSIAFWDRSGRIVAILDMTPCPRLPCRFYSAGRPYIGAVEVNRGFFKAHGVRVGDRVELER